MARKRRGRPRTADSRRFALLAGAALLLLLGLVLLDAALSGGGLQTTSGTVAAVVVRYSHARGFRAYDASELTLVGGDTTYLFVRDDFIPALPGPLYSGGAGGTTVTLWYTSSPLAPGNPTVVALQVGGARYVTDGYTHPDDARHATLFGAGGALAAALGLGVWGWRRGVARRG